MSNEKPRSSVLRRFWGLASLVLLVICGSAIGWIWHYHRLQVVLTEKQDRLIDLLTDSVSAAKLNSKPVRVALFDAGLDNGNATKDLRRLLDAELAFTWKSVSPADIQTGALDSFDAVIFQGGSATEQEAVLRDNGKEAAL